MNILFVKSLIDHELDHFGTFENEFRSQGVRIVKDAQSADIVFFKLQCHFKSYDWNALNVIIARQLPVVVFDFLDWPTGVEWFGWDWNRTLTDEYMSRQEWPKFLRMARNQIRLYFMRGMNLDREYPPFVRPIEPSNYKYLPSFVGQPRATDFNFPAVLIDDLIKRPNDLCFIGWAHNRRVTFICRLIQSGFKVDWEWPVNRLPHNVWLDRHRNAKMFIEADGGGHGSDRPYQLMAIAPMLRQASNRQMAVPWENGRHCLEIGSPGGNGDISDTELAKLRELLASPERLYEIYTSGLFHSRKHFSDEARAQYVLRCIKEAGL